MCGGGGESSLRAKVIIGSKLWASQHRVMMDKFVSPWQLRGRVVSSDNGYPILYAL